MRLFLILFNDSNWSRLCLCLISLPFSIIDVVFLLRSKCMPGESDILGGDLVPVQSRFLSGEETESVSNNTDSPFTEMNLFSTSLPVD